MTILISTLLGATALCCYTKSLKIITLSALFLLSSLKKVLRNLLIGNDFVDSPTSLDRDAKRIAFQNPNRGALFLLLILFIPIVVGGIKYSQYRFEKRQKSIESLADPDDAGLYKECAREIALEIARVWNPAKTLGEQKDVAYAIAERIYNSHPCLQKGGIRSAIPGLNSAIFGGGNIELAPSKKQFSYPANAGKDYVKISIASDDANYGKIKVQTDYQVAYAIPAQCNANIVFAIPVNSDNTAISNMGSACKNFLRNLYNTQGVCVTLIPYSGKLQLPSDKSNWLTTLPSFVEENDQLQLIGACLYGTTATHKRDLTTSDYFWGIPYPIMFRKGGEGTYHQSKYCKGDLLSNEDPSDNDTGKKYLKMNLNPCTTTSASLLGIRCTSSGISANINARDYMREPTFELKSIADACESLESAGDKSNFIFAALEWANNFFQTWTADPEKSEIKGNDDSAILGHQKKSNSNRKKVVILLVNKPDNFEEGELTYLGFKNDWDEVSKIESETLTFDPLSTSDQESSTGFIKFSGKVVCNEATNCAITCIRKRLVIITVKANSGIGTIKFTNIGDATDGVQNNTSYDVTISRELFIKPEQITANDKTIKFTATNLTIVSAEITNKVCNSGINATCELAQHTSSTAVIKTNCKRVIKFNVTPIKLTANIEQKSYVQFGSNTRKEITGEEKISLGNQNSNLSYKLENAKITKTELKIPQSEEKEFFNVVYEKTLSESSCGENVSKTLNIKAEKLIIEALNRYKANKTSTADFRLYPSSNMKNEFFDSENSSKVEWEKNDSNWNSHITSDMKFDFYIYAWLSWHSGITCKITEVYKGLVPKDPRYTYPTWDGSKINLAGESGELTVWVAPIDKETVGVTPKITYAKANQTGSGYENIGSSQSVMVFPGLYTKEAGTEQTITIDPNTYYYEPQSDGTYKITLQLQDIWTVGTPELTDYIKIFSKSDPSVTVREETGNIALLNNDATKDKTDMTEAVKTLTREAYKKLGTDTTVFLVLYKKKSSDDYSYIGVLTSNIYEADENNLEEKLGEIAKKIKELAGYSEAKIVL